MAERLLLLVPSLKAPSETFIRANAAGLPFDTVVVCADEIPWRGPPLRSAYGLSILFSKLCFRLAPSLPQALGLAVQRLGSWLPSQLMIRICRVERPDLVLVEFGFHAVQVMELVPATGLPLIVHFRGADASAHRYLVQLRVPYRRLLALASAVVVKSGLMRDTVLGLAAAREPSLRVLVSPSGANPDLFHGAAPAAAPPRFLCVGRFVAKKGPLLTLQAFAQAARSCPELELVMVGDGPLLAEARQRASQLGLAGRVRFAGLLPPAEIAQLMRGSRGFLQHSLTAPDGDQEGSPVAVMEAQLSGLPVVATWHAGIPDVVVDGETGLLVVEGNWQAMAAAISRLAADPTLAASLGQAGRKRVLKGFTQAHHWRALQDLVTAVVIERRADQGLADGEP
ncbi:glycosyltransferase [Synechococcus sp. CS-1324]|uniref:glycosyltransferase n=1 Tax=Synechococcus sp. CS-1324 TaxID=2847980 RepID=UPI000DB19216|nr:glycosyltransferase [Synechococcus sp. CS-1324]MCT0230402.1 glycosyltransferase [Synechococcus sp. CS-1324]PZV05312.1 MAG: glycosyl transferase family 1 [Cyanobium sp.]